MTDHKEVMRMALEAIEGSGHKADLMAAAEALRAAIDETEVEPVAWMNESGQAISAELKSCGFSAGVGEPAFRSFNVPLYAHPPAPPAADAKWVRLTREQHRVTRLALHRYLDDVEESILNDMRQETRDQARQDMHLGIKALATLGTFPDAAEKGKP